MVAANIHWGQRAYERIFVSAGKNSSKTKLGRNNIFKPRNYLWRAIVMPTQNTSTTNTTLTRNLFLKKSRVLTDIMASQTYSHSFTVVIVIASIFLFLTMSITAVVFVFCRKRNTVFALQKSEQEPDYDFELDELTDIEYTEAEFENEVETCSILRNKYARSLPNDENESSPSKQPLVSHKATETTELGYDSNYLSPHYMPSYSHMDEHTNYQKIVMATVLDKQGMTKSLLSTASDSDDSLYEKRLYKMCKSQHNYYGIAGLLHDDGDSDSDSGLKKKRRRNFQGRLVCGGDSVNYDSLTSLDSNQESQNTANDSHHVKITSKCLPHIPTQSYVHTQVQSPRHQHSHRGIEMRTIDSPKISIDSSRNETVTYSKSHKINGNNSSHSAKKITKSKGRISGLHRTKSDSHLITSNTTLYPWYLDDDIYDETEDV